MNAQCTTERGGSETRNIRQGDPLIVACWHCIANMNGVRTLRTHPASTSFSTVDLPFHGSVNISNLPILVAPSHPLALRLPLSPENQPRSRRLSEVLQLGMVKTRVIVRACLPWQGLILYRLELGLMLAVRGVAWRSVGTQSREQCKVGKGASVSKRGRES